MTDKEHEATGRRQSDDIIIELKQTVGQIAISMSEIRAAILGDGSKDNPGLVLKVDRLEQWKQAKEDEANHQWQWRFGLIVPIVMLILERVIHYFKGVGGHG